MALLQTTPFITIFPSFFPFTKTNCLVPASFPVGAPESKGKKLKCDWNTLNQSKMSTEHPLSVIDILGDDCPNSNLEENVGHEAHVAFSIQGLGKVDTETPVHSPERPGRNFSYGQYLPLKERMKTLSSVKTTSRPDLKHKLDAVMRDIGTSIYRSPVEPSFRSMVSDDLFGSPRQDLLSNKISSPVTDYDTNLEEIFEAGELFGKERRKNIQNATSSGLTYGISDQEEYGLPCKNELDQMEFCSSSQHAGRSYDHQDLSFNETHQWKKSTSMQSPFEINYQGCPSLYSKRKMQQYFEDSDPNIKCNYSMGTSEYRCVDNKKQRASSFSAIDDTMGCFSFRSEESCFFSAAVKGDLFECPRNRHDMHLHKKTMETKTRFCNDSWPGSFSDYPTTAKKRWFDPNPHRFSDEIFNANEEDIMGGPDPYNEHPFAAQPPLLFKKHRGFPGERSHCYKRMSEEPSIIPKPAIIIISNGISGGSSVPGRFQTSQASIVSSSSDLEDKCGDTRKEPRCITPKASVNTNASKPIEYGDEASSCAEFPAASKEVHGSGDPSNDIS
ncbi:unnamed protein product [Cuscuta epithymum]|uniref:Uncharacterized protein n=1 Tax=Cuscuta epithymum TaxID=186058 RepID=A0AAV0EG96_9ASTE|nr:unnamed protein product [Cuscuta epithymum]